MKLAEKIERVVREQEKAHLSERMRQQQERIDDGLRIYEDLVSKGWIEPARYRLAPIGTISGSSHLGIRG